MKTIVSLSVNKVSDNDAEGIIVDVANMMFGQTWPRKLVNTWSGKLANKYPTNGPENVPRILKADL